MSCFQFGLCLTVIAWIVSGFNRAKLDAQDSAVPNLIAPSDDAILDNGRADRFDVKRWEFEWTPVPTADKYRLKVQRRSGKFPSVNKVVTDTKFVDESTNYITARNQQDWTWKVQARVNGKWSDWSKERTFDVEPLNTDPVTVVAPRETGAESIRHRNVLQEPQPMNVVDVPKTDEPNNQQSKTQIVENIRGTTTHEILSLLQGPREIDFDENFLIDEPVASYIRYQPGMASHEHLRFSADGEYVAIGGMSRKPIGNGRMQSSGGGRIELWNVESGKLSVLSDDIKTHIHPTIFPVAFSPDSRLLAAADTYGQIKIWDLSTEKISGPRVVKFKDKNRNSGIASALSFTPDSKRVLVGAHPTHQLEIESGQEIVLCEDYPSSMRDPDVIELSPDGNTVAFGGQSKGVKFLDINVRKFTDAVRQSRIDSFMQSPGIDQIFFYQFLPSGNSSVVAIGGTNHVQLVVINDNSTGTITASIGCGSPFPAVAVSLDGSTLAVVDANIKRSEAFLEWQKTYQDKRQYERLPTLVSLWRINGGQLDYLGEVITGNKETVTAVGLSPDGMTLVSSGANLKFWDLKAIQTRQPKKAIGSTGVEKPAAPWQAPDDKSQNLSPDDNKRGLTLQEISFLESEGWKIDMNWGLSIRPTAPANVVDDQKLKLLCHTIRNFNANYSLNLKNTAVSDDGLKHLPLKYCVHLDLSGTRITDTAGESLIQHERLMSLSIANTAINGEILGQLTSELRILNLNGTSLSDESWGSLRRFKKLKTLDVAATNFGDEGIKALLDLPELGSLNLGRTKITEKGLGLINRLPQTIEILVTSRRYDTNSEFTDAVLAQSLPKFYPMLLHVEQRVRLEPIVEIATGSKRHTPLRETAVSNDGQWAVLRWADHLQDPRQLKLVNLQTREITRIVSKESHNSQFGQFSTGRTVAFSPDAKKMIAVFDNQLSIWNLETEAMGPPVTIAETKGQCSIDVNFETKQIALNQPSSTQIYDLLTLKLIEERSTKSVQDDVLVTRNEIWSVEGRRTKGYQLINRASGEVTELFSRNKFTPQSWFRSSNITLESDLRFKFSGDGQWLFSVGAVRNPRDRQTNVSTRVMIHSLKEQSMIAQIDLGTNFYHALPLSLAQNNDKFVTLNRDNVGSYPMVAIWKMMDGFPKLMGQFPSGHRANFLHLAEEDNKVISISPAQIRIWDIRPILRQTKNSS